MKALPAQKAQVLLETLALCADVHWILNILYLKLAPSLAALWES